MTDTHLDTNLDGTVNLQSQPDLYPALLNQDLESNKPISSNDDPAELNTLDEPIIATIVNILERSLFLTRIEKRSQHDPLQAKVCGKP